MKSAFTTAISPEGIAELKFDLPGEKVNKFSIPVLEELELQIEKLSTNSSIKVLTITSGKEGVFIAGADLHSFEPVFKDPAQAKTIIETGHRVFYKLQKLPYPTVAIINGACLGGGLEFALSCTYRLVTDHPKTQLGLPEVSLGIFPGWGGTQRLPRLIGLQEGLSMILSGKTVPGMKAYKIRLADSIVAWQFLAEKSRDFIASILTSSGKKAIEERRKKGVQRFLLEDNPLGRSLLFWQAKKNVLEKTKGRYPAPLIALEVIQSTCTLPLEDGLREEVKQFVAHIPKGFRQAPHLISLFFTQEALKKEGAHIDAKPKEITSVAVIGAGTMGAGLAWLFADHDIFTRLKDISWEYVGKGVATTKELFKKGLKAKKITPAQADRRFQLISGTIDYSGFQHADLVIEAATENLELKRTLFQEVESKVHKETLIASNTSSLTIEAMAQSLKNPERFVGMHFFNPVHKMPLVEVVAGKHTSQEAIITAVDICRKLGKTPMIVGDCPGFLVNRTFLPGANEIMLMLEEGYSTGSLEKAILDFGMPMEPFELCDEIGIDVVYKVQDVLEKAYGERMHPAEILHKMFAKELYGKKKGEGFYIYKGKNKSWNPAVTSILESLHKQKTSLPPEEIVPRFLYAMINEAARCLEEKIIERSDYLDLALIMGIGFPPFQGGLLRYADQTGIRLVYDTLQKFSKTHGIRFAPCRLIERMAAENKTFYPS